MLMRTDPFADLERAAAATFATLADRTVQGSADNPRSIPLDAWREGNAFFLAFDMPGVSADAIDIDVERNVLTVRAERAPVTEASQRFATECRHGVFQRQVILGDQLDVDAVQAGYEHGVLTLRIPVAERAKPRKIAISSTESDLTAPKVLEAETVG